MVQKKERYCYLTPDFPKNALIVAVFFATKVMPELMVTPLSTVSKDIKEAIKSIEEFAEIVKTSKNEEIKQVQEIIDTAILIPITLMKLYPLKKEYWTKCEINKDLKERIFAFLPVLNNFPVYKLLVVPFGHVEKKWEFDAAYPFSMFDDEELEKFIYGSNQQAPSCR